MQKLHNYLDINGNALKELSSSPPERRRAGVQIFSFDIFRDQICSCHKAKDLVIPENICLIWQPPFSPQCNPVENVWDEIREKWFPNLVFKSMQAVEDTLVTALVALENDHERTQSIAGFEWIDSINLNAN